MANTDIWNDLDSTLNSLDVITLRLAGMQSITEERDWSISDTISDSSSHDTWYDTMKLSSGTGSPAFTEDSALVITPRSVLSDKVDSVSSQSSSVGYHSANHDVNGAMLSPMSDTTKWTISTPKSKVRFDEMNLVMTKSPTSFELSNFYTEDSKECNNNIVHISGKTVGLRGIVKSKTTIPIQTLQDAKGKGWCAN